ncbi:hypothetical protein T265_08877 [Opisthorchis viverrini]|uniref:Uncharacterized protein n=1 Tax=Opisthorchis viverrini TaxID=6198 RepID=A0A074ZC86_OPIVI|nr:hypothetical protein T265_08877 [Opisthorchis viverrini]KER23182.1 hypothetical protein T265_08877 [Opisthorchis viverrini]
MYGVNIIHGIRERLLYIVSVYLVKLSDSGYFMSLIVMPPRFKSKAHELKLQDPSHGNGERQPLAGKNKTDPGDLGKSLDPVYQSVKVQTTQAEFLEGRQATPHFLTT